ncbi:MAG TPA: rod shape-determining protein RodA [Solirubrobacteraceae bacterium]|jgi:rod shape determining protein RodA|nr:rod shape-determining protein RodA [Solirubrobacteraceae bacterium]
MSTTPIQDPSRREGAPPPPRRRGLPFDPVLLLAVLGLCVASLVTMRAATPSDGALAPNYYVTRQGVYFAVGIVLAAALSRIDYSRLRELKYGLYAVMIGGILLVMAFGAVARGSRRAIALPFFSFQASELGKLLLVLALSAFMVDRIRHLHDRDTTVRLVLAALVPAALVMAQPDLGSALVYVVVMLAVLFVAGTSWRHFAGLFALGAAAIVLVLAVAPVVGVTVLHQYQKDRLTAFLHPNDNPASVGYQQDQSKIAIGAGQKTGRGKQATQTKLRYLPESHTDFAFAALGERYGFVGAALVLSLYALLIWRSLRILTLAKNLFGALVAGGIIAMLMFQVFVNVGMNLGIAPITGVPLPLLSYGGSSVITTLLAIGLLQSIHLQGRAAAASKGRVLTY